MDAATFFMSGEIDLSNAASIGADLLQYARALDGEPEVLIDCTELEFIDSLGLAALLDVTRQTSRRLVLRGLSPACRRPFELTGLDAVFTLE